jgi:hypothetical protein
MENYIIAAQIIISVSVGYVWIFRLDNINTEFKQYGLGNLIRNLVGATKIILATLLITGIWHPTLVLIPAVIMGLLMVAAQFFHFKVNNSFIKHLPSLFLLALCIFIVVAKLNLI